MVFELLHENAYLKRMLWGRRSEKLHDDSDQGLLFSRPEIPEGEEKESGAARVTVSVGLSCFPAPAKSPETILQQADEALSRAKGEGANRVVCFGE